jgi:high-affinity iron transporter
MMRNFRSSLLASRARHGSLAPGDDRLVPAVDPVSVTRSRFAAAIVALCALLLFANSAGAQESTQTLLHLLDYIAVDYPEAVADGEIRNTAEFEEMREFAATTRTLLDGLPSSAGRDELLRDAATLAARIEAKAPAHEIASLAGSLRTAIARVYGVQTAPSRTPDLANGKLLYEQQCAACHGAQGFGDGVAGKTLEPAPTNFHDRARASQRSTYGLYSTITLGVDGTGMRAYSELSDAQRWNLAFYVANFAATDAMRSKGASLWSAGKGRDAFPQLGPVAALSASETLATHGEDAVAIQAYLRAHPEVLAEAKPHPIRFAAETLEKSVQAYVAGDRASARQLAIQAYLEGYELAEASVRAADADLATETERAMMAYRTLLQSGASQDQVREQSAEVQELLRASLDRVETTRSSAAATFTSALVILLREGMEAILVVAAILAFLARANRPEARRWVHAGWIAALALGALTWVVSNYLVQISGASREVTEGATALISAALLLYVGYWLHSKSHGAAWQKFIQDKVGGALARGGSQLLALVSFLAVYREVFETVLFYQALSAQAPDGGHMILTGSLLGAVLLTGVAWAILRASVRLPVGTFFSVSGTILVVLAAIFAGQGIAALQEAGRIGVTPFGSFAIPFLGIHPTAETWLAQLAVALLVAAGYWRANRVARRLASTDAT